MRINLFLYTCNFCFVFHWNGRRRKWHKASQPLKSQKGYLRRSPNEQGDIRALSPKPRRPHQSPEFERPRQQRRQGASPAQPATAGLLGGRDIIDALQNPQSEDLIVLPAEALNADDIFIDDVPMDELRKALAPASICTGHEVTEALRSV